MNLLQQLQAERQVLQDHFRNYTSSLDALFEKLSHVFGPTLNGSAKPRANGHANGASLKRGAAPKKNKAGRGVVKAAILAAAEDWVPTGKIIEATDKLATSKGATYTTIGVMHKAGDLERRGKKGSFVYRRKRARATAKA